MKKENPLRNQSGSFGANESSLSRRGFLKRSGGATIATAIGWSLSSQLRAQSNGSGTETETNSVEYRSKYFLQHRMHCTKEPVFTDGGSVWLERKQGEASASNGFNKMLSSGPSEGDIEVSQMTKVEAFLFSSLLGENSGQSEKFWARAELKLDDELYGGLWIEENEDQPSMVQAKGAEQLVDPYSNLEVKAFSSAMSFAYSGFFLKLVSVSQAGENSISTEYETENGNTHSSESAAEAELGLGVDGGELGLGKAGLKLKSGLKANSDFGYSVEGSSETNSKYKKVTDEGGDTSWEKLEEYSSSVSTKVDAQWVIIHEFRKKRIGYCGETIISEEEVHGWKETDRFGPDEEE